MFYTAREDSRELGSRTKTIVVCVIFHVKCSLQLAFMIVPLGLSISVVTADLAVLRLDKPPERSASEIEFSLLKCHVRDDRTSFFERFSHVNMSKNLVKLDL